MIEPITEAQVAELEAKHGPIYAAKCGQGTLYFRRPKRDEIMVSKQVAENTSLLDGGDQLAMAVIVHPSRAELIRLLEDFPLILDDISTDIFRVARGHEEKRAKKSLPASSSPETT